MWQEKFERYRNEGFTIVAIALDAEGINPAKLYYEKFGVTFPALVDPNYATGFQAVPKTFFVNELGVVQPVREWEKRIKPRDQLQPVTAKIRSQWTDSKARKDAEAIERLAKTLKSDPKNLAVAVDLASRYLDSGRHEQAAAALKPAIGAKDPKSVATSGDEKTARLLGQAYFQLSRASVNVREAQVKYATLSFYLNPSVGYGKQIARIIAPEKFDHRPKGDFDNEFREGTLRRLRRERQQWLAGEKD